MFNEFLILEINYTVYVAPEEWCTRLDASAVLIYNKL